MDLTGEKTFALIVAVIGVFILVTLSQTIGTIYFAMAIMFALALGMSGEKYVVLFTRSKIINNKALLFGAIGVVAFIGIGGVVFGSFSVLMRTVTTFSSSFVNNFAISNPLIQWAVFSLFIPLVETLFFFGVVFMIIRRQTRAQPGKFNMPMLIAIVMTAAVATAFHFYVRGLADTSLYSDLIFFGASGVLVAKQDELTGATFMHMAINGYSMALALGFLHG